jgi:lysophospholipase L1-like esterase
MKSKIAIPNYVLSIIAFAITWTMLELLCGFLYGHLPSRFSNGKRIVEINRGKASNMPASIISHPYLLYANSPDYFEGVQQHNSLGYRSDEFSLAKDPATIRVLTLGGSTTYGYLNNDPKTTWPAVLQEMLRAHTGKKIEVINGGLKYGTSAELLAAYVFRHRYIEPDIIIFHEGGNDAIPVLFPGYDPEYSHFRGHGTGATLRKGETALLYSNVFKVFYSLWLNTRETVYRSQPYALDELDRSEAEKRVNEDKNFEGFKRNVELLIKLAKMDESRIMLFGFVQAREENLSKNRKDHIGLEKTIIKCVEKNKAIMKMLADRYGLVYINADQGLFKDEWFLDNCHLTPEGEKVKAKVVFDQLMPLLDQDKSGNGELAENTFK